MGHKIDQKARSCLYNQPMRPFVGLFVGLLAVSGYAGEYRIKKVNGVAQISGGTVSVVTPTSSYTDDYVYFSLTDTYGGSGISQPRLSGGLYGPAGAGSVLCSGSIQATLVWVPSGNEAPPSVAIVKQTSFAGFVGDTGSRYADNDLGFTQSGTAYSGVSYGAKYSVKNNPGQEFVVTIEPEARGESAGGMGGDGSLCASASVSYGCGRLSPCYSLQFRHRFAGNAQLLSWRGDSCIN